MLRVGLTGGIGCGKSAVTAMFVELGASLVDADEIAREVVAPGSEALAAIRDMFTDDVVRPDGSLDRALLRRIVFASADERRSLEQVLHPLIRRRTLEKMDTAAGPYVVAAVPLLIENHFDACVDRVLVVHCAVEQQIARVMKRDGVSREDVEAIIAAQCSEAERLRAADDVVDNTGSLEETRRQVDRLHHTYLDMTHNLRTKDSRP